LRRFQPEIEPMVDDDDREGEMSVDDVDAIVEGGGWSF
jgi:hypothetical protein